ncbi:MAG TPA: ATP-binding protein [Noviherbaspirillum sp.]|nr:ATP-binding protein [Noviherbaspirillum sp.]
MGITARASDQVIQGEKSGLDQLYALQKLFAGSGLVFISQRGGAMLFHLLAKRYERTNVAITTSPSFGEWPAGFGDAKMTTGLPDRLTPHYHIIENGNDSWRFRLGESTRKYHPERETLDQQPKSCPQGLAAYLSNSCRTHSLPYCRRDRMEHCA